VVISLGSRFFYGLLVVIGLVVVFAAGLFLGGAFRPATSPASQAQAPYQPQSGQQVIPAQQGQPIPLPPQGQANQAAPGSDPNIIRAAQAHPPDGDHPHISLPEVEQSNYTIDFGKLRANGDPVDKVLIIKNTGNKDLVLDKVQGG